MAVVGYDTTDVLLPEKPDIKPSAAIGEPRSVNFEKRVVLVSTGMHCAAAILPMPNPDNQWNVREGVEVRFCRQPPPAIGLTNQEDPRLVNNISLAGLETFTRRWVRRHLQPLGAVDTSVDYWLDHTNYPLWRRDQLRKTYDEYTSVGLSRAKLYKNKSFMKSEQYGEFKYPRAINSRSDEFKCLVGPIFALIEHELFKLHYFIKKVPVKERPRTILDRLYSLGARYMASDYTAFEALFTPELMRSCEFQLYSYMVKNLEGGADWLGHVKRAMLGRNVCSFKTFDVAVDGTRMSGEMCTSLGNSFTNLMLTLYITHCYGLEVDGFVEGDDGIFKFNSELQIPSLAYERLGMHIKLEWHTSLSEASFCGLVFDVDDLANVTDPRQLLSTFGWCDGRYIHARDSVITELRVAKALSYLHQYPGCPIVQELSLTALRLSKLSLSAQRASVERAMKTANQYEIVTYQQILADYPVARPVGLQTRMLVERNYNITMEQQFRLESHLRSLTRVGPLHTDLVWPSSWEHFASYYLVLSEPGSRVVHLDMSGQRDQTTHAAAAQVAR